MIEVFIPLYSQVERGNFWIDKGGHIVRVCESQEYVRSGGTEREFTWWEIGYRYINTNEYARKEVREFLKSFSRI